MKDRRSLILVLVLSVLALYYAWTQLSDGPNSSGWGTAGASRASFDALPNVERLDVAQLRRKPGVHQQGRDLFRYAQPPKPPPAEARQPPKPAPKREQKSTAVKPPKPQPPSIDVVYLGSFGRSDRRIAVFSDDDAIYNAVVGDVIKEKFVLVTIGYESADLGFVGFPNASPARLAVGG